MKNILNLFLLLPLCSIANTDSLINRANEYRVEDTIRITVLNNIAIDLANADYDKGLKYADSAIFLSEKIKSDIKTATAYYAKARNLSSAGQDSSAIIFYKKSYLLNFKNGNYLACGTMLFNMAISYYNLSEYAKSSESYNAALTLFKKLNNTKGIAASLNGLGIVAMELSDYTKAMSYYMETLTLSRKTGDSVTIANAFTNIGIVHKNLKNLNKALTYYNNALAIFKRMDMPQNIAYCYNNIAVVYSLMGQSKKAIEYIDKAFEINKTLKSDYGMASNYLNAGEEYFNMHEYLKADENYTKAAELFRKTGNDNYFGVAIKAKAHLLLSVPDSSLRELKVNANERYAKSLMLLKQALADFNETEDISNIADVSEDLSTLYEKTGNYKEALNYYRQHILMRDSAVNDEKKLDITKREIQEEYTAKEQEMKLNTEKKQAEVEREKLKRNYSIAGGVLLIMLGGSGFAQYKRRRDAVSKKNEAETNARIYETELKALRAQMNPHFMFNSLNSIADYINKNNAKTASEFSVKFAKLMRMVLENSESREIPLADDLKTLELYMQLEALRMQNKFSYSITVAEDTDAQNILIPPLLIQPFVENSILHGIAPLGEGGKIEVRVSVKNNMLNILVQDNGAGRKTVNTELHSSEHKSMGMKITRERIELFSKQKNAEAGITTHDLNQGTMVEIILPIVHLF